MNITEMSRIELLSTIDHLCYCLREIVDIEKSANYGWNGLSNAVSIAKKALSKIEEK